MVVLIPLYQQDSGKVPWVKLHAATIGLNWIWFNCFIGLIMKDAILEMLMRAGIDVIGFVLSAALIEWYIGIQKGKR